MGGREEEEGFVLSSSGSLCSCTSSCASGDFCAFFALCFWGCWLGLGGLAISMKVFAVGGLEFLPAWRTVTNKLEW